jgi:hypothetical protein
MVYGPKYLAPYLPESVSFGGGSGQPVEGTVKGKLPRDDKLLITVSTPDGASLVTFTQKVEEISLLVDVGDHITLKMGKYEPFVMNPTIIRVDKEGPAFGGTVPPATRPPLAEPQRMMPEPKKQEEKSDMKQDTPRSEAPQPQIEKEETPAQPPAQSEEQKI